MTGREAGFTRVELLVVSLLSAVVLAGVYRTLVVQERSYEAAGLMIHDRESLRTALGILESELAEVSSIGGARIGHSDVRVAASDSITFRAPRKTGFFCTLDRAAHRTVVWSAGEAFEAGDRVLLFVDNDSILYTDDRWDTTTVAAASNVEDAGCTALWDQPLQYLELDDQDLAGIQPLSPVRAFEYVTYSLRPLPSGEWALARRTEGDATLDYLVDGLAPPGQGLRFEYYTPAGTPTNDPAQIEEIRITVRTDPGADAVQTTEMALNLYLRNN